MWHVTWFSTVKFTCICMSAGRSSGTCDRKWKLYNTLYRSIWIAKRLHGIWMKLLSHDVRMNQSMHVGYITWVLYDKYIAMGHAMKHVMSVWKVKISEPSSHRKAGKKIPKTNSFCVEKWWWTRWDEDTGSGNLFGLNKLNISWLMTHESWHWKWLMMWLDTKTKKCWKTKVLNKFHGSCQLKQLRKLSASFVLLRHMQ